MKFLWIVLSLLLFFACDSNKSGKEYSFERSIQEPIIEKRCMEGTPDSVTECYLLKWRIPVESEDLVRVHIWVDTSVIDSADETVSDKAKEASIKKEFTNGESVYDSLDLTAALADYKDRDDTVQIALWAEYKGGGSEGRIVRTFVLLGDDIAPARVQIANESNHNTIKVQWRRPIDQTDFYRPDSIDGPIYGYNVVFKSESDLDLSTAGLKLTLGGKDISSSIQFQKQWSQISDSIALLPATDKKPERHFAVRDGKGFQDSDDDLYELTVTGLTAESQYSIYVVTLDVATNESVSETKNIRTTDSVPPLQAKQFWVRKDSLDQDRVALDSNRVFLYWVKPVDPFKDSSNIVMTADSLKFPAGCKMGECYRYVQTYFVETNIHGKWEPIRKILLTSTGEEYPTWALADGVMKKNPVGKYVGDTLKWVSPGDTVMVRMRVQDSSGAYSEWLTDTLLISRGVNTKVNCPAGFKAVNRRTGADTSLPKVVCVEQFEHQDSVGNFITDVLYQDSRAACQALSATAPGFQFDLCTEDDWLSACLSRNSSYGTIQEYPFEPQEFLYSECNQGTGVSSVAASLNLRSVKCTSPDGIRDLPGQYQEWARGLRRTFDTLSPGKVDTLIDTIGILKGSSYVNFETTDPTVLARCGAVATPTRMRPRYTRDSVYLYQNGVSMDTLENRDTTRKLYSALPPSSFRDEIRLYEVLHPKTGAVLGEDYVSQKEFDRRGGEAYLESISSGLGYRFLGKDTVLLLPGFVSSPDVRNFYREPSVGFRCCAVPNL